MSPTTRAQRTAKKKAAKKTTAQTSTARTEEPRGKSTGAAFPETLEQKARRSGRGPHFDI